MINEMIRKRLNERIWLIFSSGTLQTNKQTQNTPHTYTLTQIGIGMFKQWKFVIAVQS